MPETRSEKIAAILQQVRHAALSEGDGAPAFLQDLQDEIERLPGAAVGFATRDAAYLERHGYFEDRPEMSAEEKQAALNAAASDYEENPATQDGITVFVDQVLDRVAPVDDADEEIAP